MEKYMGKTNINRDSNGRFIKGHKPTPEMIEKDRKYHLGKKHSEETKKKISNTKKGTKAWNKGIPNILIRGKNHPMWNGGTYISKEGYRYIYDINYPNKNKRRYVLEHRLVMEKHIGRYLTKEEIVHHINGKVNDNRIENLLLLNNQSTHMEEHNKFRLRNNLGRFIS